MRHGQDSGTLREAAAMTTVVALDRKLDTQAVGGLCEMLKSHRGADLTLDVSATHQIGALSLQTLMVAASSYSKCGHPLLLTGMSDDLARQFELFGVDPSTLTVTKRDE